MTWPGLTIRATSDNLAFFRVFFSYSLLFSVPTKGQMRILGKTSLSFQLYSYPHTLTYLFFSLNFFTFLLLCDDDFLSILFLFMWQLLVEEATTSSTQSYSLFSWQILYHSFVRTNHFGMFILNTLSIPLHSVQPFNGLLSINHICLLFITDVWLSSLENPVQIVGNMSSILVEYSSNLFIKSSNV